MTRARMAGLVVGAALLSVFAARLSAHHSFAAEFDATKPVSLKGAVTKVERINPHGWIYIDVKTPEGKLEHWAIETGAPNALARQGVRKDSIPIGLEIVVKGYRAKDGSTTANGSIITLPDGRDLSLASSVGNSSEKKPAGDESGYR